MDAIHDEPGRLLKVLLPSQLVRAMDATIDSSGAYASRMEFIRDAIEGHMAELGRLQTSERVGNEDHRMEDRTGEVLSREATDVYSSIPTIPEDVSTLTGLSNPTAEPTWGMHNRDFPTLWALWHLVRLVRQEGGPVPFSAWVAEATRRAWLLPERLSSDDYDTAGFPSNREKPESSEGRFVKFFLGAEPESGPAFSLGLVGTTDGRIAPTPAGLSLLVDLVGISCRKGDVPSERASRSFLGHLRQNAPADYGFFREVLTDIKEAKDSRSSLVRVVTAQHPEWSRSVVETNVAGFVGRAREWGLLEHKQHKGRYLLTEFGDAWLADCRKLQDQEE